MKKYLSSRQKLKTASAKERNQLEKSGKVCKCIYGERHTFQIVLSHWLSCIHWLHKGQLFPLVWEATRKL